MWLFVFPVYVSLSLWHTSERLLSSTCPKRVGVKHYLGSQKAVPHVLPACLGIIMLRGSGAPCRDPADTGWVGAAVKGPGT